MLETYELCYNNAVILEDCVSTEVAEWLTIKANAISSSPMFLLPGMFNLY